MKPNILYIFADQWRYQAVGCHGADQVLTPCIDRFAGESKRFTNAYSTFPLCSPHRASLLTGKYPLQVGMWTNCKIGLEEKLMLKPQETCMGNVLKDFGYQTGYIGKWHLDASELNFHPEPESGAKDWDAYTPPGERRQGFDYWLSYGACDEHLDPHYWADSPKQIRPGMWSAQFETDKAMEFMEERKDKTEPFALFLSYNPPHLPYELVPEEYYKDWKELPVRYRDNVPQSMRTEKLETITRQYFAAVAGIDHQFGRLMAYLKEQDLEENTLVVLSADHGEMLGSHGKMSKNIWYDESIHIPFMIRQTGRIMAGENQTILASPDHMPTLLELLDLPVPVTCQGYSHAKSVFGEDENAPTDMFLCSFPGTAQMVAEFEKAGLAHKAYGFRGIKTKRYTYVVNHGYAPGEKKEEYLYDSLLDPYELEPKRGDQIPGELRRQFQERLWHYLDLTGDPFLRGERS